MINLTGKTALVVGVANKSSIAWAITQALVNAGATVALTYQNDRVEARVKGLAADINPPLPCMEMDATNEENVLKAFGEVGKIFNGKLDMLVHCIAFANKEDLDGNFIDTSTKGFLLAHEVSAYTLISLSRAAKPLMEAAGGGSIITLTYLGSEKVIPNYNVMGVAKASLEASIRYLAADLGALQIRVNGVSAGPMNTLAARGISGFSGMLNTVEQRAPLKRNVTLEEVGNTALFLLSPLSSGITGEVIYVDGGYNIMGM